MVHVKVNVLPPPRGLRSCPAADALLAQLCRDPFAVPQYSARPNDAKVGLKATLKLPEEWKRQNLRVVVFVQERVSRHIPGAAVPWALFPWGIPYARGL